MLTERLVAMFGKARPARASALNVGRVMMTCVESASALCCRYKISTICRAVLCTCVPSAQAAPLQMNSVLRAAEALLGLLTARDLSFRPFSCSARQDTQLRLLWTGMFAPASSSRLCRISAAVAAKKGKFNPLRPRRLVAGVSDLYLV